jgi:hypothetical protein
MERDRTLPRARVCANGRALRNQRTSGYYCCKRKEKNMSVALELPPVIEQEVRYCANARGISFVQFLFELVEKEAARIRAERARRVKPNVSDFIGYGLKFDDTPMTTAEYMAEMREGEAM